MKIFHFLEQGFRLRDLNLVNMLKSKTGIVLR